MAFFVFSYNQWLFYILLIGWAVVWSFVFTSTKQRLFFFLALILFIGGTWGLINSTPVQNFLVKRVTKVLSKELQTTVSIKHVDFSLFDKMLIEGVLVEDRKKDTLLYAGTAKVKITDWFFLKDKATLKYLGLNNTVINLNRTDSIWNYTFLLDYFTSPQPKKKKSGGGLEFDFKVVEMENLRLNQIDKWVGKDLKVSVYKLKVDADSMSLSNKMMAINTINLDNPVFYQSDYTGNRPEVIKKPKAATTVPAQYKWNNEGWWVAVNSIHVSNGSFQNEKETERLPYTDKFDGQHLLFGSINGDLKNVRFEKDTLTVNVNLATKEKTGFEVKKLQAALKFTPDVMEFNHLDLVTNYSKLGSYYAMHYENFNSDMSDFLHSVRLEGKFDAGSKISSEDIAFFAPEVKSWKRTFDISGTAKGTIDNLVAKNMLIKSGNTSVDGDIALRGLPDIKNTFIDFKSNNLITNYSDLVTLVPSLKDLTQPQLSKLGDISFKGTYTGFINDFVTYGYIKTGLGDIVADLNMKLPDNKPPTYSGKISSSGFNLGKFINTSTLGNIALDGNISGSGFTQKDLNANFKGNIKRIDFSGYTYSNISIDGSFIKQIFTGHGDVNDPNLKIDNFNGSVSLANKDAVFNFDAVLQKSNLQKLHFTNEDFSLNGHFNLNFTGTNIDNFLGTARVYNASLRHDSTQLSFDSLTLKSYVVEDKKYLSFQSNEVEGNVTGSFKILELPDAFKVFLNRYYPAYIKKPGYIVSDQDFSFVIKTKDIDQYVQLIDSKLKGFNNADFNGSLRLAKNELNVNATIPEFEYDKKIFNNLVIESKGNYDTLFTKITTGDITLNDSLHFPGTNLTIRSHNDVSTLQLKTSASKTLSNAELNATVKTLTDGVMIHFSPSSFIINDKKWQLEKDGELTIRKSYIDASEVKFVQGDQEITFSTEPAEDGTDNTNVIAKLKKVNIDDFAPFFLKKPRLEGLLTGTVTLKDPFGKPIIEYDATANDLRMDDKLLGTAILSGSVNTATGLIKSRGNVEGSLYKFNLDGTYNYKKDTLGNQLDFNFSSERFDVSLLNTYLGSIFSDMKGNAVSTLKLSGGSAHPLLTGDVTVTDGSLKVNYTQCTYNFTNETIIFNPDEIDLGTMQLKDVYNNTGTASGKMHHVFFDEFDFDNLRFETGKMLLLNTNEKDNNQFYGKVIGRATMTLNGPVTDMRMKIVGEPSNLDSSHIYLPTGSSREAGVIDYIDFIQFGTKMEDLKSKQGTNISVDMELRANPSCKIDVILDEVTGDVIKGQGNGLLKIKVGTKEPVSLSGRYDITEGEYKFIFQTFLQKYFTIKKGSSITWNGDPYLALININAEYLAPNVDLSSLATSRGKFNQKSDLSIIAHLTNTLKQPKIAFEFVLPADNYYAKDPIVQQNLLKFTKDENEMNRQVASLLLFNSFINDKGFGGSTASFFSGTAGQVISGFLNNQLAKFFQKIFKDPTITPYLSLNSSYDITSPELIKALQASGNFGFKKEYLNGRLIVTLGGNIDYNNPYILAARNTNVLLTPDVNVEYILTADGKLRIVGFNRTSVDATLGQRNRTGVRLSYQKEFDKLTPEEKRKKKLKDSPVK